MNSENLDDVVASGGMRRARNVRRIGWVGCLWVAAWISICLEQFFTNTDSLRGIRMGAVVGAFVSPFMLIILVPAGLIGRSIGNWKPLRRYRWWISLALPWALCFVPVVLSIRERIDPPRGFERYFDVTAPKDAVHFTSNIDNIAMADLSATYSFECSRSEAERLIRDLDLRRAELTFPLPRGVSSRGISAGTLGWTATKKYDNHRDERYTGFIEMWTDETLTHVCIWKWNT